MTTVLLVGGAGYVGSHCARGLATSGYSPVVYDDCSTGYEEAVRWGVLEHGDLLDAARLADVFQHHKPDAVLHFAAKSLVGESFRNPELYWRVNVEGTRTLLSVMEAAGCTRLVYSSSCAVYGAPQTERIDETLPIAPINPYGETKAEAEKEIEAACDNWSLRAASLRYFNAAGAAEDASIGEAHEPETHLIPLAIKAALGMAPPLTLFGTDFETRDGTAIRDYVHVEDLADAHARALRLLESEPGFHAINLGCGREATVREVLEVIRAQVGRPVPYRQAARREGDAGRLVANSALARKKLGWEPRRSLDRIIEDAVRWHSKTLGA